jgi:hypothetical protein
MESGVTELAATGEENSTLIRSFRKIPAVGSGTPFSLTTARTVKDPPPPPPPPLQAGRVGTRNAAKVERSSHPFEDVIANSLKLIGLGSFGCRPPRCLVREHPNPLD